MAKFWGNFFKISFYCFFITKYRWTFWAQMCTLYILCTHLVTLALPRSVYVCFKTEKRKWRWCSTYTTSAILRHLILCRPFFISCFLLKKFAQLLFFVTPRPLIPHNTLNIFSPIQFFSLIPSLLSPIESSSFIIIYFSVIICIIPPIWDDDLYLPHHHSTKKMY